MNQSNEFSEVLSNQNAVGTNNNCGGIDDDSSGREEDEEGCKSSDSNGKSKSPGSKSGGSGGSSNNKGEGKSRRELPAGAVATLKEWLLSPEHFTHPYPTPQDQAMLMEKTGIDKKQLKNWFTNARRRIWKPMLKKQLEQGKLATTGTGNGGAGAMAVSGFILPGFLAASQHNGGTSSVGDHAQVNGHNNNPQAMQAMQSHYKQAFQQQQQEEEQNASKNINGNTNFSSIFGNHTITQQPQQIGSNTGNLSQPLTSSNILNGQNTMNKTDSHAILMELFARDQDLVRQAAESAKIKAAAAAAINIQQPRMQQEQSSIVNSNPVKVLSTNMNNLQHNNNKNSLLKAQNSARIGSVQALNTWPHFSSVSSLNTLGTLSGVKSITNMSSADLASQGNMNKNGNLAQVKSVDSMGRADSYAFLEIFFDDRSNSMGMGNWQRQPGPLKREREEDNDVGLSLDGDDAPSSSNKVNESTPNLVLSASSVQTSTTSSVINTISTQVPSSSCLEGCKGKDACCTDSVSAGESRKKLKLAYDDALAARGLLAVSRSSENLIGLALPAKMRRTLSQEYLRQQELQTSASQQQEQETPSGFPVIDSSTLNNCSPSRVAAESPDQVTSSSSVLKSKASPERDNIALEGQNHNKHSQEAPRSNASSSSTKPSISDPTSVEVPFSTKCALCQRTDVDTQLRPCGHMFHGSCLKPLLRDSTGPPKCPIDCITMQSAVLAVPTEEPPQCWNATPSNLTNSVKTRENLNGFHQQIGAEQVNETLV